MILVDFNKYVEANPEGGLGAEISEWITKYKLWAEDDYNWFFDRENCYHCIDFTSDKHQVLFLLHFGGLCLVQ